MNEQRCFCAGNYSATAEGVLYVHAMAAAVPARGLLWGPQCVELLWATLLFVLWPINFQGSFIPSPGQCCTQRVINKQVARECSAGHPLDMSWVPPVYTLAPILPFLEQLPLFSRFYTNKTFCRDVGQGAPPPAGQMPLTEPQDAFPPWLGNAWIRANEMNLKLSLGTCEMDLQIFKQISLKGRI